MNALTELAESIEHELGAEDAHAVAARRDAAHMQNRATLHANKLGWGGAANDM